MHLLLTLAAGLACAILSSAAVTPIKRTKAGQTFTVSSPANKALNGKSVNVYFNNATDNPGDYDVVTKLGTPLIYQLREGEIFQQAAGTAGNFADTGLVGGLEFFQPPVEIFQFRNSSSLNSGSYFDKSIQDWYLSRVGTSGTTYALLATTTSKSHGFFACLTPDTPPTRAVTAKGSHYVIACMSL